MPGRPETSRGTSRVPAVAIALIALPVLYLLPFLAVFLDEVVFGTRVIMTNMPDWIEQAFEIVYWPILRLFFR